LKVIDDGLVRIDEAKAVHLNSDFFYGLGHFKWWVVLLRLSIFLLGHEYIKHLVDKLALVSLESVLLLVLMQEQVSLSDSLDQNLANGRVIVNFESEVRNFILVDFVLLKFMGLLQILVEYLFG